MDTSTILEHQDECNGPLVGAAAVRKRKMDSMWAELNGNSEESIPKKREKKSKKDKPDKKGKKQSKKEVNMGSY